MTTTNNNNNNEDKDQGNVFIKHLADKLDEIKNDDKKKK